MFNFLKKKFKVFEKNLEDEIEAALKKEAALPPTQTPPAAPQPAPIEPTPAVPQAEKALSRHANAPCAYAKSRQHQPKAARNCRTNKSRRASKTSCSVPSRPAGASSRPSSPRRNQHGPSTRNG